MSGAYFGVASVLERDREVLSRKVAELEAKLAKTLINLDSLRYFAESMAEHDCTYGDGCPSWRETRHGTCHGCEARNVLAALLAVPGNASEP